MTDIKYSYRFTKDAANDLRTIFKYSHENWGQQQAEKYLRQLQQQCDLLCQAPSIGQPSPDIDQSTHRFPYAEHMLYYKIIKSNIIIYAVLHKSMAPELHLTDRKL